MPDGIHQRDSISPDLLILLNTDGVGRVPNILTFIARRRDSPEQ
ncbi:hypothetical protein [Nocardia noduli]|nr:hypothetical protein [Nocardia noduli]